MSELPTSRILLLLLLPYPFVFIFNADSRAEGVEFPTLYASRLSDIFFNASFCRFGRFRFGCFKKGREWVEQGFSKKKYYPQGWRFFLKTIEHPNPGFTFAPRTGTIHLMRLPERPSKMEVNGCGGILDMKCSGKRKKGNVKKRDTAKT
jgi:hypothetical protein